MRYQQIELRLVVDLLPDLLDQLLVEVQLHGLRAVVRLEGTVLALDERVDAERHAGDGAKETQLALDNRFTNAGVPTIVYLLLIVLV